MTAAAWLLAALVLLSTTFADAQQQQQLLQPSGDIQQPEFVSVNGSIVVQVGQNKTFAISQGPDGQITYVPETLKAHSSLLASLSTAQDDNTGILATVSSSISDAVDYLEGAIDDAVGSAESELSEQVVIANSATLSTALSDQDVLSTALSNQHTSTLSIIQAADSSVLSDAAFAQADLSAGVESALSGIIDDVEELLMNLTARLSTAESTLAAVLSCNADGELYADGDCRLATPTPITCAPFEDNIPHLNYLLQVDPIPEPLTIYPGDVMLFRCDANFFLASLPETSTCLEYGGWSVDPPNCSPVSSCSAGQYVFAEATATSDRDCRSCPSGKYSTSTNAASCTNWDPCGVNKYQSTAPTSSSNRVCSTCGANTYQPRSSFTGTSCQSESHLSIMSCSASSEHDGGYVCRNAYNGNFNDGGGASWATRGQGAGAWLRVNFAQPVYIRRWLWKQRNCNCEWFKTAVLENQSPSVTVAMPNGQGPYSRSFDFIGPTTYVVFRFTEQWSRVNNGLNEMQLFGVVA